MFGIGGYCECRRAYASTLTIDAGFTAFAETAEPEEVMSVLAQYHAACHLAILVEEFPIAGLKKE